MSRNPHWQLMARVFARDESRCRKCGATDRLEIDHIMPWSAGGTTTQDNLQVLCHRCNQLKGSLTPEEQREWLGRVVGFVINGGMYRRVRSRAVAPVRVLDVGKPMGRVRLLVTPEAGSGQAWVWADKVEVER